MAKKRLSMRKIKDVLRQFYSCGMSKRNIARSLGISHSTVCEYVMRAMVAGIKGPLPEDADEDELERRLFPGNSKNKERTRPSPDMKEIARELRRKGVTLQLLWQEYRTVHEDGYRYSQFCELYRQWKKKTSVVMRQEYQYGQKLFVDYAGDKMELFNQRTGEIRAASLFVAVLGASNYIYVEAVESETLQNWIFAHVNCFEYLGGVAEVIVPDNLKVGVTKSCRYEPELNKTYHDMAIHFNTVIIPARPRKPRDKAKVEAGVLLAIRWIIAALRKRTFFNLRDLNASIRERLVEINEKPFKHLDTSRRELFEKYEKPALKKLPAEPYEYAEFKQVKVNIDYHVNVCGHRYSVPWRTGRVHVEARVTIRVVEIIFKGQRIATHPRSFDKGYTTNAAHMPKAHRAHSEWTPARLINWAKKIGPWTGRLVRKIMESRDHPEQGYRSCLGIIHLQKKYTTERVEEAAKRAIEFDTVSYGSLKSILRKGLDQVVEEEVRADVPENEPGYVRGADDYQ